MWQIRATPKVHLALQSHSFNVIRSSEDAHHWDQLPPDVHIGGTTCQGKACHIT
jgi:hypothetical protein